MIRRWFRWLWRAIFYRQRNDGRVSAQWLSNDATREDH